MSLKVFVFILIGSVSFCTDIFAQAQDYLWPTDASQYLTSTFGETRSAHFHSGLDIKTWGREGYRVFASKDGVVYRLGVSVKGYGKVIYLKHSDGSFTVYAHLQRLNDDLQAYVDSIRMLDYSFEVDLYVENEGFEVKKGDVIGFTGSTGVGPPHLHFEIRDKFNEPINALRSNLFVQDSIPPTISALIAVPLDLTSSIRNSNYPQIYYPTKSSTGTLDFGVIESTGPLGLTVSTFDEADGVTNKYAVYELGLIHQGDTLFYERLDQFRFEEDDLMFLDRIPALGASRRSYQTLYKKDGPENPFYQILDPRAIINPSDSIAHFRIFARDFYGNETQATLVVDGSYIPTSKAVDNSPKPPHLWHYWTENWLTTNSETIDLKTFSFGQVWDESKNQKIFPLNGISSIWSRINPDVAYSLHTPNKKLAIDFSAHSFFDTLTVVAHTGIFEDFPYFNIQPSTIPSRNDFNVQFYLDDSEFELNNTYQLYRIDRLRDRMVYVESKLIGRTVHAWPSELGEFLIMPDNDPPVIEEYRLEKTSFGKWFVYINALDSLSGINFKESEIYVNGIRGIVEYDNEEDILIYYHPEFEPQKENIMSVKIKDKAGNIFTSSYQL